MDVAEVGKQMVEAVRVSLGRDWKDTRRFAEPELRRLATALRDIAAMTADGEITPDEARSLLRIHRNTTETVMLAAKGMGILAVENAINEALGVVRDTVNNVAGVALL